MEYNLVNEINEQIRISEECDVKLRAQKHYVGMHELNQIYATCMKSKYSAKMKADKDRFEREGLERPLITFTVGDNTYDVVFGFKRDYKLGEYINVDELLNIMGVDRYDHLIKDLDTLESIFMTNTQQMYHGLSPTRQATHSELHRVIKSKKQPYLYMYNGRDYKHYAMGLFVVRRLITEG